MNLNNPKAIKSRLIDIYNEELLNLNLFIFNKEDVRNNRDLKNLFLNRISAEISCLDKEDIKTLPIFLRSQSFYKRVYQLILKVYNLEDYIEHKYQKEISEIEKLVKDSELDFNHDMEDKLLNYDYLESALQLDDASIVEIAYNHSNPIVRSFALGMVDKPHVWIDFLLNDPDSSVRTAALYYLFGEEYLANLLNNDCFGEIPIEIELRLNYDDIKDDFGIDDILFKRFDKLIISKISIDNGELVISTDQKNSYEDIVSKIDNQHILKAMANYHNEWSVRYVALNKIKDIDYLYELALNGFDKFTKPMHGILYYPGEFDENIVLNSILDRIIKLKDLSGEELNEFLKGIITDSKEETIKNRAQSIIDGELNISNLSHNKRNQNNIHKDDLGKSGKESSDFRHEETIRDFKENRILADLARNDDDWTVRKESIESLVGKFMTLTYKKSEDRYLYHLNKRNILERLINEEEKEILSESKNDENEEYVDANSIVLYEDEKPYTLQDLLVDRAYNDTCENVRECAVSYISKENILFDIVNNDESIDVRLSALDGIKRNDLLAKIFVKSKNHHVYKKAISKIKYEYILLKLACIKNYYGELWPKRDLVNDRLNELGFKVPNPLAKDDNNEEFLIPAIDFEEEMSLDEMLELDRFIKSLINPNESIHHYEDSDYYNDLLNLDDNSDDDLNDLYYFNDSYKYSNEINLADFPYQIILKKKINKS